MPLEMDGKHPVTKEFPFDKGACQHPIIVARRIPTTLCYINAKRLLTTNYIVSCSTFFLRHVTLTPATGKTSNKHYKRCKITDHDE